jgi:hypothetical protein
MKKFGLAAAVVTTAFTIAGNMRDAKATRNGEVNAN